MKPVAAEFVTSVAAGGDVPTDGLPTVALIGRSNVGKSSLINALVKQRIARSGGKPGTTRLLNVYRVETPPRGITPFILVDLPGYGYARGGTQARREFDTLTRAFFDRVGSRRDAAGTRTVQLAGVLLVVDIRHPGLTSDVAALAWAVGRGYSVVVVATKADRMSRTARDRAMHAHTEALNRAAETQAPVSVVVVSARTGDGVSHVWTELKEWLRLL